MPSCTLMEQLWASRASSGDVSIVASGDDKAPTHVRAHRCIVEAASPVFAAALRAGMKEAHTREIEVPGIDEVVVTGVLGILYTGKVLVDMDWMHALAFIHKYQIAEAAKFIAPIVLQRLTADSLRDVVRFLRDFDTAESSGPNYLDIIAEQVASDRPMLVRFLKML
eukprot:UN1105